MRRYKTETRTGLVALYDIRPGNGAGQFLQPRSPHGAIARGTFCLKKAAYPNTQILFWKYLKIISKYLGI